jgi:peptide/nickel transport system substrate-binding protein
LFTSFGSATFNLIDAALSTRAPGGPLMSTTRRLMFATCLALGFAATQPCSAQGIPRNLPRNETLILENPEGTIKNAGWFNIWAINAGSQSNGLQQAALDTLWYVDPNRGIDGVWDNSLAAEKPAYNADFTEMTVKLRRGLRWSDGVEFTAADVVHTVATQIKHGGMRWSAALALNVDRMETPDPYTIVFRLKKPNSRFHLLFTVRWNAVWIMPKHVFEKVEDPPKFDFNKPVSLGAYVLHSYDPDGKWYIWQLRDDWQRTSLGRFGKPGPKYLAYVDPGPPDKRVIAQMNHELDVIHDVAPEGMFTLARQSKSSRAWFRGFPYAHPDPTLPALIFNTQNDLFKNRDVRWALALLIDIKAVSWPRTAARRRSRRSGCRRPAPTRRPTTHRWRSGSRPSRSTPESAGSGPTIPPWAGRLPTCCGPPWASRSRPTRRRSPNPSAWAGGSPILRPRRSS